MSRCDALVEAGRGATLLIHEATFGDDRVADARQKRHSTRGEALDVAARMGARRTILTHLSQRYRDLHETMGAGGDEAAGDDGGGDGGGEAEGEGGGAMDAICEAEEAAAAGTSMVAFDLMAINLADLEHMPRHMRTLAHFRACERRYERAMREAATEEAFLRSERLEREAAMTMEEQRRFSGGETVV